MKVGIIGVRDLDGSLYTDQDYINNSLLSFLDMRGLYTEQIHVLTGGGRGTEQLVLEWCKDYCVTCSKIPPNIAKYGVRRAFIKRNNDILNRSDTAVIFWDGYMDITQEAIAYAAQRGLETCVFPIV